MWHNKKRKQGREKKLKIHSSSQSIKDCVMV